MHNIRDEQFGRDDRLISRWHSRDQNPSIGIKKVQNCSQSLHFISGKKGEVCIQEEDHILKY